MNEFALDNVILDESSDVAPWIAELQWALGRSKGDVVRWNTEPSLEQHAEKRCLSMTCSLQPTGCSVCCTRFPAGTTSIYTCTPCDLQMCTACAMAALFVIEPPEGRAGAVVTGADDAGRWLLRRVSPQLSVVDHGLRSKCIELQLFDNNQKSFAPIWQISQAGQDDAATLGALLTQHETIKHLPTGRVGVLLNEATAVMTPDAAASATRTTNCFVSVRFKHGEPPYSVDRQSIVKATAEEAAAACLPLIWQSEHSVWQSEHSDD